MILEGNGVKLRAVEPEDLDLLYNWENEEANWKQGNTIVPYSRYILKKYIAASHKSIYETAQLRLMIDTLPGKRTVGTVDLFDFDHFHKRAGVGILIASVDDRKKGYASAALERIINYAFGTLGLYQLWCNIAEGNEDSMKLFLRHGFVVCATKEGWLRREGQFIKEYMLQLINPDT